MRKASLARPDVYQGILEKAEKVFREFGYAKTTVGDIAHAAGMSPANVYRFFESKAAIHEALTGVILGRGEELAQKIAKERGPVARRLKRLIVEMHRFTREQYLQESRVHEIVTRAMDEQWGVIQAHIQRVKALYIALIGEGMRTGEFEGSAASMRAICVFNAAIPFCHPQIVSEQFAEDQGRQAAAMADFLVQALKGRRR